MTANSHIYTIYKGTNLVNGKAYIGFDKEWPERKREHFYAARYSHEGRYIFHHALTKYGPDSFHWDILYQSKDRDHTLKVMEEHFIREYHTHMLEGGYNMTWGGDGFTGKHSEETKKLLSEVHKGQIPWNKGKKNCFTEEAKNKMGWSRGKRVGPKGKTYCDKWIRRLARRGIILSPTP